MPKQHRLPSPNEQTLLGQLRVASVPRHQKVRWDRLVRKHHYLKSARLVGEQLRYAVTDAAWLTREQGRWGIENRTYHTLDVTPREDESRVHHPNAASVLGLLRRLANAFKQVWAQGRPKRQATARDWTGENLCNRWLGVRLFTRSSVVRFTHSRTQSPPALTCF